MTSHGAGALITPLVLTFNEAANIDRTLMRLRWADRVVVVDSHSTDDTVARCAAYSNVQVVQHPFEGHAAQWNFALAQVQTEWVLTLDADYCLSDELVTELAGWQPEPTVSGYMTAFTYCIFGRRLAASLYPPRLTLFRRSQGTYVIEGHTQQLRLPGEVRQLRGRILHDDRKSLDRWFKDQLRYSELEARYLSDTPPTGLRFQDRIRRRGVLAPLAVGPYVLVVHRLVLAGWPGWYYALQRTAAEVLLSLRLVEQRCRLRVR